MKLKVLDQVHVSAVQADCLRPQQEVEVDDGLGEELLKAHPTKFERIGAAKRARPPRNKAAPAHADKAVTALPARKRGNRGA